MSNKTMYAIKCGEKYLKSQEHKDWASNLSEAKLWEAFGPPISLCRHLKKVGLIKEPLEVIAVNLKTTVARTEIADVDVSKLQEDKVEAYITKNMKSKILEIEGLLVDHAKTISNIYLEMSALNSKLSKLKEKLEERLTNKFIK